MSASELPDYYSWQVSSASRVVVTPTIYSRIVGD